MPATIIIMALAVAAAIGGGVSIAAQHSTLGEPLYTFKVLVNDRINKALHHSSSSTTTTQLDL